MGLASALRAPLAAMARYENWPRILAWKALGRAPTELRLRNGGRLRGVEASSFVIVQEVFFGRVTRLQTYRLGRTMSW